MMLQQSGSLVVLRNTNVDTKNETRLLEVLQVFDFLNLESLWSHLESLWSHLESLGKNVRISPFHYGENEPELELPTEFHEL